MAQVQVVPPFMVPGLFNNHAILERQGTFFFKVREHNMTIHVIHVVEVPALVASLNLELELKTVPVIVMGNDKLHIGDVKDSAQRFQFIHRPLDTRQQISGRQLPA